MAHLVQRIFQVHNRLLFAIDLLIFLATPIATAMILQPDRIHIPLDFSINSQLTWLLGITVCSLGLKILGLYSAGVYRHLWRYASVEEGLQLLGVMLGVTLVNTLSFYGLDLQLGRTETLLFPLLDGVLSFVCVAIVRFSARMLEHWYQTRTLAAEAGAGEAVLIVGAGSAGVCGVGKRGSRGAGSRGDL